MIVYGVSLINPLDYLNTFFVQQWGLWVASLVCEVNELYFCMLFDLWKDFSAQFPPMVISIQNVFLVNFTIAINLCHRIHICLSKVTHESNKLWNPFKLWILWINNIHWFPLDLHVVNNLPPKFTDANHLDFFQPNHKHGPPRFSIPLKCMNDIKTDLDVESLPLASSPRHEHHIHNVWLTSYKSGSLS